MSQKLKDGKIDFDKRIKCSVEREKEKFLKNTRRKRRKEE